MSLFGRTVRQIRQVCQTQCGPTAQAHHIIADKTFRLGTRKENWPRITTSGDFKPFPTLDSGAAICLDGAASVKGTFHNLAHRADTRVTNLGKQSDIPGLEKVSDITDLHVESAVYARPDCKSQIIDEVNTSMDGTDPNALGRTTRNPPKPGSPAHNNLNGPNTH